MTNLRFVPDSSCLVAAALSWHEHHALALSELESRLDGGQGMALAAHALVETYSVLTRLPAPHRLAPESASSLIEDSFLANGNVAVLDGRGYARLLHDAPSDGIRGGRVYDAVIARTAIRAGARVILTFNETHFAQFASQRLEVIVPGRGG